MGLDPCGLRGLLGQLGHDIRSDRLGAHGGAGEHEAIGGHLEHEMRGQAVDGSSVTLEDGKRDVIETNGSDLMGLRFLLGPSTTLGLVDRTCDREGAVC